MKENTIENAITQLQHDVAELKKTVAKLDARIKDTRHDTAKIAVMLDHQIDKIEAEIG